MEDMYGVLVDKPINGFHLKKFYRKVLTHSDVLQWNIKDDVVVVKSSLIVIALIVPIDRDKRLSGGSLFHEW